MTLMVAWGDWVGRAGLGVSVAVGQLLHRGCAEQAPAAPISSSAAAGPEAEFRAQGVVLAPAWRVAAALLRMLACGGLLWMGVAALSPDSEQINSLTQMWMFAGLVLAPKAAAWSIRRAFAATMRVENGLLVLEQRERRIEIRVNEIAAVEPWKFPLPGPGLCLRLQSGRRWSHGIAVADPTAMVHALISAGGQPALADPLSGLAMAYAAHEWPPRAGASITPR